MLKKINLKLSVIDSVKANVNMLKEYLKEKFNLNEIEFKIFSENHFEITFPLTYGMDYIIAILDNIIVYLRDSLKIGLR